ncbi:unnamed protein product [Musa acuminata subsp. burmannicoides]
MFPLLFIQIRRKDFPQQNKQNREISSYNWGNLIFYQVGKILSSIMPPQDVLLTKIPILDRYKEWFKARGFVSRARADRCCCCDCCCCEGTSVPFVLLTSALRSP